MPACLGGAVGVEWSEESALFWEEHLPACLSSAPCSSFPPSTHADCLIGYCSMIKKERNLQPAIDEHTPVRNVRVFLLGGTPFLSRWMYLLTPSWHHTKQTK